jgi:hypothetical protein
MKIRVVGSPLFLDTFTALGANPTQMSWADAQPAHGAAARWTARRTRCSVFTAAKLHTVGQKHLTMWGYVNDPLIFVVNKDIWNSAGHPPTARSCAGRHRSGQGGDRHRPQRHGRGRQALAQGHRRHGRDRDRS